jgi:DNA-directed RNA polymerase specialized sigma24 family protein
MHPPLSVGVTIHSHIAAAAVLFLPSQRFPMDSRLPFPLGEYWYSGSPNPAMDALFRRVCASAWPYALFCAHRYLHDVHAAYDLMDAAVSNAEQYYERFHGERTFIQLSHRIMSVLKRLAKQRVRNNREISYGSLSDLGILGRAISSKPEAEQSAYINEMLGKMSERSQQITYWRLAGHSWRQIANTLEASYVTVRRSYHKELRGLLFPSFDKHSSGEPRG